MPTVTLVLDEDDYRSTQEAFARLQRHRDAQGLLIDQGSSDLAGALVGEICRGWLEMIDFTGRG